MGNKKIGSINVKLSLTPLDQKLNLILKWLLLAAVLEIIVVLAALGWLLDFRIFNPLQKMTDSIFHIDSSNMESCLPLGSRRDEVWVLTQEFNSMLSRINSLVHNIKEMTDNIAHDLRSPITRIRGTAEVTLTTKSSLDDYMTMAAITIEECDSLLTIINAMLYISETDAGIDRIEKEPVDIIVIIRKACELLQPVASENKLKFAISLPEKCIVNGNLPMLQRMVANILDNAMKYTPAGGTITISAECGGGKVKVSITDTGIGIPEEDLPNIFKRFFRCEKSRTKTGIGLGLSLSAAIAKNHGGKIEVISTLGKGSTFTIKLPNSTTL